MFSKNYSLLLLINFFFLAGEAQTSAYSLAAVSEVLKNKASVITHLNDISVEIENLDKATLHVHKVFTVVSEEGRDALLFTVYSTKYLSLDEAEIRVYDQNGKQVGKYKKKDMATTAVGSGLVEDGYMIYYRIASASYPITVDVTYEQKLKSTLIIPDYRFINAKEAVVESNYTVKIPTEIGLHYKAKHCSLIPVIKDDGKYATYKWSVKDLPAIEQEEGSVSVRDRFPYVNIVTNQFSHYGFHGDFSSWKSFGAWINDLYKGLDELPADQQQLLKQLVSDAPNETEKVRRIYHYLQQNFRYVSIQLGIGGLQPFSAAFTSEKKYGDCKGLSNYMKAALKAVGIKSYVAIINSDYNEEPVDPEFPANDFDHVILCVPGQQDSIWLECTSSVTEFGKLGTFTENRNALLITENGGVLVATPKSKASANLLNTHTTVKLENDFSAMAEIKMETAGEYSETMTSVLKEKRDDQKETLVYYMGYKQPDDFELTASASADNQCTALKMQIRNLPEFNAGNKYFIKPRINKNWSQKLPTAENRKMDFYFHYPFEKHDTTIIKLPSAFKATVLPKEQELHTNFSYYHAKSWYNEAENAVYTATTLVLENHKIPAADYASVKSFFDQVIQDDAQRIVITKAEGDSVEKKTF